MMNVTYKTYKGKKIIENVKNRNCFSQLFNCTKWDKISLKVDVCPSNVEYKDFWIKLMLEIEPKATLDGDFITIPRMSNGKTLLFLSMVRYLWENSNKYDIIVRITKEIIKTYPKIDKFKAISMAASSTNKSNGWGHSIVAGGMANKLVSLKKYQNYNGKNCTGLLNDSQYNNNEKNLFEIRKAKKNPMDIKPIIKFYNYE